MKPNILVALLGRAGAGKSTVANDLIKRFGSDRVTKLSLAKPGKEIVRRAFDLTDAQVYGTQADKEAVVGMLYGSRQPNSHDVPITPRWLLQRVLTEGMRAVMGDDVFVDIVLKQVLARPPDGHVFVVDDVRFLNEVERLRSWRSITPDGDGLRAAVFKLMLMGEQPVAADHASEAQIDLVPPDQIDGVVLAGKSEGSWTLLSAFYKVFGDWLQANQLAVA